MQNFKKAYGFVFFQFFLCAVVIAGPFLEEALHFERAEPAFSLKMFFGFFAGAGVVYLLIAIFNLGKSFTPNPIPRETGALITSGLYSFSRHPIYTAVLVITIGWTGFWFSWVSAIAFLALLFVLTQKTTFEEKLLLEKHGAAYATYMKRVNRFLPWKSRTS